MLVLLQSLGVVLYVLVCGALPFDGPDLKELRNRVLSGRFRIPYFMSSDCEHLVRRMLVLDVKKRYTVSQVMQHKWFQLPGVTPAPVAPPPAPLGTPTVDGWNEHILQLMASKGIDRLKTLEVVPRFVSYCRLGIG